MIRFAKEEDLERVNEIRKAVIFKGGFDENLRDYIYEIWNAENKEIIVAEREGVVCGFACIQIVDKPENPFMHGRRYLDVDEFGVDERFRRQGVATEMIGFIRAEAKKRGIGKVELNMWEFNRGALSFYEAMGFRTYRRYMELESE